MSVTRQQLKSIVKECLVEILAEGIGSSTKQSLQESSSKKVLQQKINSRPQQKSLPGQNVKYSHTLAETIKREAGGNSIMEEILADTAMTTLPNTMMNEGNKQHIHPVGTIENVIAQSTPEELFGDETASKWAQLAFTQIQKKF